MKMCEGIYLEVLSAGFRSAGCWRTGRGGHRPTLVCLASIVGRWPPRHVLPTLGINNKYRRGLERAHPINQGD